MMHTVIRVQIILTPGPLDRIRSPEGIAAHFGPCSYYNPHYCCTTHSILTYSSLLSSLPSPLPSPCLREQVPRDDLVLWCQRQSAESKRIPAPADAVGNLKLRDVADLQREFEKAVAAGGSGGAQQDDAAPAADRWSGVGWTRNENEHD